VVIGDIDVPVSLRQAIQEFHAAVWNGDLRVAWRFGSKIRGAHDQLVRALMPDSDAATEALRRLEEADFGQFSAKLRNASGGFTSWQLRDIRTNLKGFEYVATIAVRTGTDGSGEGVDCDEVWSDPSNGWSVNYDRLADLMSG
jgi:hypothetical protein